MIAVAIAICAFGLAFWGSLRIALAVLIGTLLLVPSDMIPPGAPSSVLTVQRLTAIALLLNLGLRVYRREIPRNVFSITPVHAVFLVFLAASFLLGVSLAQPDVNATAAIHIWFNYAGEFGIFIVALAGIRAVKDTEFVVATIAVVLLITAGIGIIEHLTGSSYERLLHRAPILGTRGGEVRIRVASNFALSYAWVASALVPLFVVAALTRLHRWLWAAMGLAVVMAAIYWTHSRSVFLDLIVVLLALAVIGWNARVSLFSILAVAIMAGVYFASATVVHNLSAGIAQGSIDVRFQRIPSITAVVASHAFGGLGFGGVADLGFQAVDSTYLWLYGDIGVIGLTLFVLLYFTAIATAARGILAADPRQRVLAAAVTVGIATVFVAGFVYDTGSQLFDQHMLWVLVALGAVIAEQSVGEPRWFSAPSWGRLAVLFGSISVGAFVYATAPTSISQTVVFSTLPTYLENASDPANIGQILVNSVCAVAKSDSVSGTGVHISCEDPNAGLAPQAVAAGVARGGPGQGELQVHAPTRKKERATLLTIAQAVDRAPHMRQVTFHPASEMTSGRPTLQRTAPVWIPMVALVALVLLPRRRARQGANLPSTTG
ncbi:MAG: O-antigen ligase family protein [Actinomycetes bacterium]